MPYVTCPTCAQVGYGTAGYAHPVLCAGCGAALPSRRQVVPRTALPRRLRAPAEPASSRPGRDMAAPGADAEAG
jgi:hypothetical protein